MVLTYVTVYNGLHFYAFMRHTKNFTTGDSIKGARHFMFLYTELQTLCEV